MAFIETLRGLSLTKKLIAAGAIGLVAVAMMTLVRVANKPPMALLYAGVDTGAAAEIVTKLDAEGVAYKIDGERIYVDATARDRLRLTLAQEGLPRQSVQGYELLDDLNGFATTSDMFSAAYWRAKEGELTRTLLNMPGVRAARVHIGAGERSPFTRNNIPRSASVTITAPAGLTPEQVKAIQHVTALAVTNLHPDAVAVVDTTRGLLTTTEEESLAGGVLDEDKRAAALETKLLRLLEARVGQGNARVKVALQLRREREALTEQQVDPNSAVVTTRTRSESREQETGRDQPVTIASELPDGDATTGESNAERTETREEVAYAVTTRDRTVERLPGQIERVTVAVLLNHLPPAEGEEATQPRDDAEIAALQTLLEAAAGIDAARGDVVTIQSLAFEQPDLGELVTEAPSAAGLAGIEPRLWQVGQLGFLGLVALILGLFVVRPILTSGKSGAGDPAAIEAQQGLLIEDPLTMLKTASTDEPDAAAALLNAWLEEEEEVA